MRFPLEMYHVVALHERNCIITSKIWKSTDFSKTLQPDYSLKTL